MMTKRKATKQTAEKTVRDIRRATRRKYSAEEKIRIVSMLSTRHFAQVYPVTQANIN